MSRRAIGTVLPALGIVTTAGIASTVVGVRPVVTLLDGDEPQPPALLSVESAGAHCPDDFIANASTSVRASGANTRIAYSRNISLPSPSYAVGDPTFERVNESTYVLSIPTGETSKAARECHGVARYTASMRIPAGDDAWRVIVQHDGTNITTTYGDSDRSPTGGSASAGGSASMNARLAQEPVTQSEAIYR